MSPTRGTSASPDEIVEWQCPYCDNTRQTLTELQNHITETTTGRHKGISGESPDEDLLAYGPNREVVDRFEGTKSVRPRDAPIENASKRKQIVACWLANDREKDVDAITAVTEADRDYVIQILSDIRRGEITPEYWESIDDSLVDVLEQRLDEYNNETDKVTSDMSSGEPEMEVVDVEQEIEELTDEYTKQALVTNAWLVAPGVRYQDVADLLGSSNEHARRTYRALEAGEVDVERLADVEAQETLAMGLREADALGDVGDVEVRLSLEDVPEWWREGGDPPTPRDGSDDSDEGALPGTAKERVLAALHYTNEAGESVLNRELGDVAGCSTEHARRIHNEAVDADFDESLFEEIPNSVWNVVARRLVEYRVVNLDEDILPEQVREQFEGTQARQTTIEDVEDVEVEEAEPESESTSGTETEPRSGMDREESLEAARRRVNRPESGDVVPASEVERVYDIMDAFRREAKEMDNRRAEVVANEAVMQLARILKESSEQ